jgi:thiaminase/transcriptional activator TenA
VALPLHEVLWKGCNDLAEACARHPFVLGLAGGSLDPEVFKRYVAQDAFFLDAFARAYALAAARCRRVEDLEAFHRLLGGVIEEKRLHRGYAAELGIDLERAVPNPAARAYTDFLLRAAWTAGPGETLAAMTPCMRLYAHLGGALAAGGIPGHRYRKWIETYSSREFEELARSIEELLDRHAANTQPVRSAYRYAMSCELDFFTAALEGPTSGERAR